MEEAEAPAHGRKHFVELATITVGVLIALSLEGGRQWMSDRALVREAEENILQEMRENRDELARVLAGDSSRQSALEGALQFADDLLADGTTDVNELNLGFSLAEVSSSSWTTAERTGAIAHMDYGRVRELSRVYEAQDLFVSQQTQNLARLSAAMAVLSASGDPQRSEPADMRVFRDEVLRLRADLYIQRQLAERTQALYEDLLGVAGASVSVREAPR
jgi:hypothetical protein